jgi:hypothetical protein
LHNNAGRTCGLRSAFINGSLDHEVYPCRNKYDVASLAVFYTSWPEFSQRPVQLIAGV